MKSLQYVINSCIVNNSIDFSALWDTLSKILVAILSLYQ